MSQIKKEPIKSGSFFVCYLGIWYFERVLRTVVIELIGRKYNNYQK